MSNEKDCESINKSTEGFISVAFLRKMENAMEMEEIERKVIDNHSSITNANDNRSTMVNKSFTYKLTREDIESKKINFSIKINNGIEEQTISIPNFDMSPYL